MIIGNLVCEISETIRGEENSSGVKYFECILSKQHNNRKSYNFP